MIGTREIDTHEALTIASSDGALEAAYVPGAGMVCCSLRHEGEEVLGQRHGLRGYVEDRSTMGIPLLYPWANRLGTDHFEVAGETVDLRETPLVKRDANGLPIHGLLTAYPAWEITRHEATSDGALVEAALDWAADPELMRCYPFPHRLRVKASIDAAGLEVTTTIEADGRPVPIAFGFHPYLAPPAASRREWMLLLPLGDHIPLGDRGLPAGPPTPRANLDGPLGDRSFDDLFTAARPGTPLTLEASGRRLTVAMDAAFPYTQLYSPAGADLLAIEPMTAATNALLEDPQVVTPGTRSGARYTIGVETMAQ